MRIEDINLTKLFKLGHNQLVKLAQQLKYKNNKTIDRLYYKYSDVLKDLKINYMRQRIDKNTSDEKLISFVQEAYNNLTIGGGGKLGAKELKSVQQFNIDAVGLDYKNYELLYNYFLENETDIQINDIKFVIGSDIAYNENMFKGSRIERTNKIMKFLKDNDLLEQAESILL